MCKNTRHSRERFFFLFFILFSLLIEFLDGKIVLVMDLFLNRGINRDEMLKQT